MIAALVTFGTLVTLACLIIALIAFTAGRRDTSWMPYLGKNDIQPVCTSAGMMNANSALVTFGALVTLACLIIALIAFVGASRW